MRTVAAVLVALSLAVAAGGSTPLAAQSAAACEAFKIHGGQVHAVEAIFEGMPANTASGWR